MPGPLAEDEAVAVQVERPARLLRGVVARRQGGQQVEAGDAERVDHAVRAAGEHQRRRRRGGSAPAPRRWPGCWRRRRSGRCSSARRRSKSSARWPAVVCSSCSDSRAASNVRQAVPVERRPGRPCSRRPGRPRPMLQDQVAESPGCPRRSRGRRRSGVRSTLALSSRPASARACWAAARANWVLSAGVFEPPGVADVLGQVEVLDLGGERGREGAGVEVGDRPDAALALELVGEQLRDGVPQRGDRAHAGDDDATRMHVCSYASHRFTTTAPTWPMSVKFSFTAYGLVTCRTPSVWTWIGHSGSRVS